VSDNEWDKKLADGINANQSVAAILTVILVGGFETSLYGQDKKLLAVGRGLTHEDSVKDAFEKLKKSGK